MKMLRLLLAGGLSFSFAAMALQAAGLVRGPYLQMGTSTSIVFRWRTDIETDGVVRYGVTTNLDYATTNLSRTTNHTLLVTNLHPDTLYHYAIGDRNGIIAGDATYFFKSAPSGPKPTRIWVIGDSGTASVTPNNYHSEEVFAAYNQFAGNRYTDVWLMLGDNAYSSGEEHEYQAAVFEVYNPLLQQTTLWSTIGNHDTWSLAPQLPYFDIFTFPRNGEAGGVASATENYYSFNYGDIHFVCLDSEMANRSTGGSMAEWLETDLSARTNKWLIAFWHTPPYSRGSNPSDENPAFPNNHSEMRNNFVSILERHGVDLVLNGHSHSYERSFLLDGHYGRSETLTGSNLVDNSTGRRKENGPYFKPGSGPHEGAIYIVAGSSGWTSGGSLNHPAMCISLDLTGSVVLDVNGNDLDGLFLGHDGEILDRFAITKGIDPEPIWLSQLWLNRRYAVLRWSSEPGRDYIIEQSLDPSAHPWNQLTLVHATSRFTTWTNTISDQQSLTKSFYRIKLD